MIGHPALREVVGADPFRPVATADLRLAIRRARGLGADARGRLRRAGPVARARRVERAGKRRVLGRRLRAQSRRTEAKREAEKGGETEKRENGGTR